MANNIGRQAMPKYTVYSFEDKDGKTHKIQVPDGMTGFQRLAHTVQVWVLRLIGAGFFFFLGYLVGSG